MAFHCILLRHGTPVPEEEDPERPLSDQGHKDADAWIYCQLVHLCFASGSVAVLPLHSLCKNKESTASAVAAYLQSVTAGRDVPFAAGGMIVTSDDGASN